MFIHVEMRVLFASLRVVHDDLDSGDDSSELRLLLEALIERPGDVDGVGGVVAVRGRPSFGETPSVGEEPGQVALGGGLDDVARGGVLAQLKESTLW